jgi:hypothetical protein
MGDSGLIPNGQPESKCVAFVGGKAWLTIGVPTVPRRGGADYLTRTIDTLLQELPLSNMDPLYGKVVVLIMNNRPGEHPAFTKVRSRRHNAQLDTRAIVRVCGGCKHVFVQSVSFSQDQKIPGKRRRQSLTS